MRGLTSNSHPQFSLSLQCPEIVDLSAFFIPLLFLYRVDISNLGIQNSKCAKIGVLNSVLT